ncbi:MAG: hypothetical protein Tsb005_04940 [Gammaproteobacteria bacterium]
MEYIKKNFLTGNRHLSFIDVVLSLILLTLFLLYGFYSEDKQYIYSADNNLCGIYCKMAMHYGGWLVQHDFDKYYFQKSFGSLIIFILFKLFGIPLTSIYINYGLQTLSAVALIISLLVWIKLMRYFQCSNNLFWLSFVGLFCSQLFLKILPYIQESPDTLAFAISIFFLYAWVKKHHIRAYLLFSITLFIQPQAALVMIPLLLTLPKASNTQMKLSHFSFSWLHVIREFVKKNYVAIIWGIYALVFFLSGYILPLIKAPYFGIDNTMTVWLPFSILLASIVMTFGLIKLGFYTAVTSFLNVLKYQQTWRRLLFIFAIILTKNILVKYFAQGEILSATSSFKGTLWVFYGFQYQMIEQPLKSVVAHIIFYGPILLLIITQWKKLATTCYRYGFNEGMHFSLCLIFILSTDAESRHLIAFMPWLCLLSLLSCKQILSKIYFCTFFVTQLLVSRIWSTYGGISVDHDPSLLLWGPWWSVDIYLRALGVTALLVVLFGLIKMFEGGCISSNSKAILRY